MKFVITWKVRFGGSAAENEANAVRLQEVLSKWTPAPEATIHQFVIRSDGEGGFAVVENDNLASLTLNCFKLAPYVEYAVYPVLDVEDTIGLGHEAIEFRKSV